MEPKTQRALSVSEFVSVVNELLGGEQVLVEGEISEFKLSQNKWVFFSLKDQEQAAVVECFMMAHQLTQPIENGMLVQVLGRPGVHQRSGRFRISVYEVTPVGEGALARALALLKTKLEKEGLFTDERKRSVPYVPETIGLIASRESAAYSDFMKVLQARFGGLAILTRHVQVEGEAAIADITRAFTEMARAEPRPEVIVLTRGGGSLESLAAFNSEAVARAIFGSPVPVVVGVGHERDLTIADLVADVRASTPSNAAELLVPERQAVLDEVVGTVRQLEGVLARQLSEEALLIERFPLAARQLLANAAARLAELDSRLKQGIIWVLKQVPVTATLERLARVFERLLSDNNGLLIRAERLLASFNPQAVLKRGYSIVYKEGQLIRSVKQVAKADELEITVGDGKVSAEAL